MVGQSTSSPTSTSSPAAPAPTPALRSGRYPTFSSGRSPTLRTCRELLTPVQITGHVGDSSAKSLLAEVLLMTKMNWNSARFAEKLPVTVRFANEVGTILRDLPDDYAPEARYAFYM
jgi:hypothetical protein